MDVWAFIFLVNVLCHQHNNIVTPAEALAVSHIESRDAKNEFRFGPMGKGTYGGAFGIRNCFPGWDDPILNCVLGVQTLSRLKIRKGTLKDALKIYNQEFDSSYWAAVRQAVRKYAAISPDQEEQNRH